MRDIAWARSAHDQFLAIWEAADEADLPALEQAVQGVFADLQADPLGVGESRDGRRRVVSRPPLTVWFEVLDAGRRVRVVRVHRPARRG